MARKPELARLSYGELLQRTLELRARINRGESRRAGTKELIEDCGLLASLICELALRDGDQLTIESPAHEMPADWE